jgi:hypothetical protein
MSDTPVEDEENTESEGGDTDIKALRDAAKRGQAAVQDAAASKRELAFVKAGVDTDSPLGQLAMTGYAGDLEPAKIKEFMETLGAGTTPPPAQEQPTPEEIAATQQRQQVASGSIPPNNAPPPVADPRQEGLTKFHEALKEGASREDASAEFYDRLIDAAAKGDQRVLLESGHVDRS